MFNGIILVSQLLVPFYYYFDSSEESLEKDPRRFYRLYTLTAVMTILRIVIENATPRILNGCNIVAWFLLATIMFRRCVSNMVINGNFTQYDT